MMQSAGQESLSSLLLSSQVSGGSCRVPSPQFSKMVAVVVLEDVVVVVLVDELDVTELEVEVVVAQFPDPSHPSKALTKARHATPFFSHFAWLAAMLAFSLPLPRC